MGGRINLENGADLRHLSEVVVLRVNPVVRPKLPLSLEGW